MFKKFNETSIKENCFELHFFVEITIVDSFALLVVAHSFSRNEKSSSYSRKERQRGELKNMKHEPGVKVAIINN